MGSHDTLLGEIEPQVLPEVDGFDYALDRGQRPVPGHLLNTFETAYHRGTFARAREALVVAHTEEDSARRVFEAAKDAARSVFAALLAPGATPRESTFHRPSSELAHSLLADVDRAGRDAAWAVLREGAAEQLAKQAYLDEHAPHESRLDATTRKSTRLFGEESEPGKRVMFHLVHRSRPVPDGWGLLEDQLGGNAPAPHGGRRSVSDMGKRGGEGGVGGGQRAEGPRRRNEGRGNRKDTNYVGDGASRIEDGSGGKR